MSAAVRAEVEGLVGRMARGLEAGPLHLDGTTLLCRFGAICRQLGLSPSQTARYFGALPYSAQRAAWDDLVRHLASTWGTAP